MTAALCIVVGFGAGVIFTAKLNDMLGLFLFHWDRRHENKP